MCPKLVLIALTCSKNAEKNAICLHICSWALGSVTGPTGNAHQSLTAIEVPWARMCSTAERQHLTWPMKVIAFCRCCEDHYLNSAIEKETLQVPAESYTLQEYASAGRIAPVPLVSEHELCTSKLWQRVDKKSTDDGLEAVHSIICLFLSGLCQEAVHSFDSNPKSLQTSGTWCVHQYHAWWQWCDHCTHRHLALPVERYSQSRCRIVRMRIDYRTNVMHSSRRLRPSLQIVQCNVHFAVEQLIVLWVW